MNTTPIIRAYLNDGRLVVEAHGQSIGGAITDAQISRRDGMPAGNMELVIRIPLDGAVATLGAPEPAPAVPARLEAPAAMPPPRYVNGPLTASPIPSAPATKDAPALEE